MKKMGLIFGPATRLAVGPALGRTGQRNDVGTTSASDNRPDG
ncbi:hypothetical protein Hsw_3563 [Hymenobacter swuensis DY53]|uniref:Uncharacterized protein n=1 Tax=Hymenobacter swuensis DY53 TaxID=1227739 RepID=W8F2J5_9BACT|nr:hypothetical protein Hsw_3563 [Hymenobacter swuensis DY53]